MKKNRFKSGFTLAEAVVALSVSIVAIAMLSIIVVNLFSAFDSSIRQNKQINEFRQVKTQVANFVSTSNINGFEVDLSTDFSDTLKFSKQGQNSNTISFSQNSLYLNKTAVLSCEQIKNIGFALCDNLIVCKVCFLDNTEITFIA